MRISGKLQVFKIVVQEVFVEGDHFSVKAVPDEGHFYEKSYPASTEHTLPNSANYHIILQETSNRRMVFLILT